MLLCLLYSYKIKRHDIMHPLSFQDFFGVNFWQKIFFLKSHGAAVFNRRDFWFVAFLKRKAEHGVLRKLKHIFPNTYQRIKSICSPAKGGTGCYRFNYQPGS